MALRPAVEPAEGGVRLFVKVTPRASRTAVQGVAEGAEQRLQVRLAVTAVPEDGKANAAVIALLAKTLRLAKTSIQVVAGGTDRSKVLFLAGDPQELAPRLAAWVDALPH